LNRGTNLIDKYLEEANVMKQLAYLLQKENKQADGRYLAEYK
jgi:hypothetical protein